MKRMKPTVIILLLIILILTLCSCIASEDKVLNSLNDTLAKQKDVLVKNNYNRSIFDKIKPVVCVVIGIENLLMKVSVDVKLKYNTIIETAALTQTIKFIFVDTIDIFKKIEYDSWYKAIVKNNQGIWLGNGIADQYTIKLSK